MTTPALVAFYSTLRKSPDMWAALAKLENREDLIAGVQAQAAAQGIDLSKDDIAAGLSEIGTLVDQAAGDDALTDDELELVAAGANIVDDHKVEFG